MKETSKGQSPPYVRYLGWLTRPFPDFDFFFIKSVRKRAAELLELKPGDRVIDAGCGSGGSFPFLVAEIGDAGEIVGIEISPESTASARRRIEKNGWSNVSVVESPAEDAVLTGIFDGLLMFAAPDVFASDNAWKNLTPYLTENARVAFFGAKLTHHWLGAVLNPVLRALCKLSFSTTPDPDYEPWNVAKKTVEEIKVNEYFFGLMFLASGRVIK
jgi:demethylmenaquinone methyltransferase/2-methoxy-6-polyprenyl-1,4-benzoquinol methylase